MARPSKDPSELRTQRFNLRFTLAEIETLRANAAAAGQEPHEYARRRVLGHRVPPAPSRGSDPALLSELNRIGVNVNQLARSVHRGSDFQHYWREVGAALQAVLAKVAARDGS
ncbi:MAG: plasmid mobilization relaxosome protein MobC [Pseudomonadota bacterium]